MIGWEEHKLGDIVEIGRGASPRPIKNYVTDNPGIPWVKIADATKSINRYIDITNEYIIEEGRSKTVYPGELIVSNSATPGIPKIMKIEACVHDGWLVFDNYKNIETIYLYYFFLDYRRILAHSASGTVFKNLTTEIVRNVRIKLPPLSEQKSIAKVLTAFDDKIELLQAQNKTLETMAQTIFKEWFGKYQIGDELPEGWRVSKINDFVKSSLGGDYGKEIFEVDHTEETICLRGTDLPDMKIGTPQKAPIRFLKPSKLERCKLENGDIVVEISGGTENQSTGRAMYINEKILSSAKYPMTCVNFCRIIRPLKLEYSYFIYSLFDYLYSRKVFFNWENGTTGIKNLNLKALLEDFDLHIPEDEDLIPVFNNNVKAIFNKIQTNNNQILTISQTRDTLLPKLMSGQVRVNNLKQTIDA